MALESTLASVLREVEFYRNALSYPSYNVSLIEREDEHWYRINDEPEELPGTTGILQIIAKPWLIPWAKKIACQVVEKELLSLMNGKAVAKININTDLIDKIIKKAKAKPDKIRDKAADIGTRAHQWIDAYIKSRPMPDMTKDIAQACDNFLRFWDKEGLTFLAGDTKVASRVHRVGGSLDWLALDKSGKLVLGDNKTSNFMSSSFGAQIGGYSIQLKETFGIQAHRGIIIRIGKTDLDYEIGRVNDLALAEKAFLAAKTLKEIINDDNFVIKEKENNGNKNKDASAKERKPKREKCNTKS